MHHSAAGPDKNIPIQSLESTMQITEASRLLGLAGADWACVVDQDRILGSIGKNELAEADPNATLADICDSVDAPLLRWVA